MILIKKQKVINTVILIVATVSLLFGFYFYYKLHNIEKNSRINNQQEASDVMNKVSRLYLIPEDEDPTIATVSDPSILKNQSFFTLAEKGDKVIIFTRSGKAILYRPSIDKIIETAPIKNNPLKSDVQNIETNKNEKQDSN